MNGETKSIRQPNHKKWSNDSDILAAIDDKKSTRHTIAALYARKIVEKSFDDVSHVNRRICERWSGAALVFIKREALKVAFGDEALQ